MRIWSIHPSYLDTKGILALWREGLLAKKVLEGKTKGYTRHPQLLRFKSAENPLALINLYLAEVYNEAKRRSYNFDKNKVVWTFPPEKISVTQGQLHYEWLHLLAKLKQRSPQKYAHHRFDSTIESHPLFQVVPGEIENWEIVKEPI